MRVFISWSGELSRQLGEAVRNWLPSALQHVKPYFTPDDIDKGAKWGSELAKELSSSSVCIIILTRDNLASNWIMFEAGAISSALERTSVCPIVFDMLPTDLQGPLAQFQVTQFIKADIRKLFNTINSLAGENKLEESTAGIVFEKWWPDLEKAIKNILEGHTANPNAKDLRSERDLIQEILLLLRATEKEKLPSRPPASPYEESPTAHFMSILKHVVDEEGVTPFMYLHSKLRELEAAVHKLNPSHSRTIVLHELSELIERTMLKAKPRQLKDVVDMDDDIPF